MNQEILRQELMADLMPIAYGKLVMMRRVTGQQEVKIRMTMHWRYLNDVSHLIKFGFFFMDRIFYSFSKGFFVEEDLNLETERNIVHWITNTDRQKKKKKKNRNSWFFFLFNLVLIRQLKGMIKCMKMNKNDTDLTNILPRRGRKEKKLIEGYLQ